MDQEHLPEKVAKDLSQDNLQEIKKVSDEIVKKKAQDETIQEIFFQVIEILSNRIGPEEQLDSLSDLVITNYFYLIASSADYEKFFKAFEESVPIDYESVLYKAIELEDGETILHLITKKPELLNITLRSTFSKQTMREFLISKGWGEHFKEFIEKTQVATKEEPKLSKDDTRFGELKSSVKKTVRRKAA